jgi:DNA-binding NtrC family response regulator
MIRVLIADDDKNLRKVLVNTLSDFGFEVSHTDSGTRAMEMLTQDEYDVLLLDLNMPRLSGMDVLKRMKASDIPTEVIILTANGTVSTAVEAMKLGAHDYIAKPFKTEELKVVVEKAYEKKKIVEENHLLRTQIKRQCASPAILTASPLMNDILKILNRFAASEFPVLVHGESGVGKELVARAIHDASPHADGPFIPVNCGAIPETVIESELFGHEAGAFTGAHAKKPGLLEIANNGTLFLDEVGELPQRLQVKFLRAIETGRFFRVGGTREVAVAVRFVAATNKDLKKEVEQGAFRADLYYRISALSVHIPPLRERREDIPLLAEHFIKSDQAFRNKRLSEDALRVLSGYSWPGNVRELRNVVQRALLLSRSDTIHASDLPADLDPAPRSDCWRLEDVEREHILKVLRETGGERGRTARMLGISPKTLYNKLQSYGIDS